MSKVPANSVKPFIILGSLPPSLRDYPPEQVWKPIKDEIRKLVHMHGKTDIQVESVNVETGYSQGHLLATCEFKQRHDAEDVYSLLRGHKFKESVLQQWLCEPGPHGTPTLLKGPRDPVKGDPLRPPVPFPPIPLNSSISGSRDPRTPFGPRSGQTESPTYDIVADLPRRNSNFSPNRAVPQPLSAGNIPMHESFSNIDAVLAPHETPFNTDLNLCQQHLGHFSLSRGDASDLSDSSRTLPNSPALSSSSGTSSVSAIPDVYLPSRSPSYDTFPFVPGSPYPYTYSNHNSSFSSTSSVYTPSISGNQSSSSHTFQASHTLHDTASDASYKVIIRNVKAGVTHDQLSELLEQRMPPGSYVQHETPKQTEDNKWSVKFSRKEDAEKAKEKLNNFSFKGWKLKVHVSNGGSREHITSGSSITSSTVTSRPSR